jgi:hypothetical protein
MKFWSPNMSTATRLHEYRSYLSRLNTALRSDILCVDVVQNKTLLNEHIFGQFLYLKRKREFISQAQSEA